MSKKTKMSMSELAKLRGVEKPVQAGCSYDASFEQQEVKVKESSKSKQPAPAQCAPEPLKQRKPIELFKEAAKNDGWKVVEVNGHRRIAAKYAASDVLRDVYAEDYLVDGYKAFVKLPRDGVVFTLSPKEVFWEFIQEFQCIDEAKLLVLQEVLEYWEQDLGLDLGGANLKWNNSWVDVTKQIYAWRMDVTGSNKNNPPLKFEGGRDFSRLGDSPSQHAYRGGFGGHHD